MAAMRVSRRREPRASLSRKPTMTRSAIRIVLSIAAAFQIWTPAIAQTGSFGGSVGKDDKSISGSAQPPSAHESASSPRRPREGGGPSLAGRWTGKIECSWFHAGLNSLDMTVVNAGGSQFTLTGNLMNAVVFSGQIRGRQVNFEAANPLNKATFQGSVVSPTSMRGTYTQTIASETCTWFVNKAGGASADHQ